MNILVADATADIRLLLKLMLEYKGHCVVEAADGRQAVEAATNGRPDVILMDLNMPLMDGIEAARCLRRQPETSDMPIIAVTTHCKNSALHRRAMAAGCVEYIGKPLNFKKLDQVIARLLAHKNIRVYS
jgi:two-component system cell cycle response regulator DivK